MRRWEEGLRNEDVGREVVNLTTRGRASGVRLGLDARDAFARAPRGIGKALRELIRHMLPLVPEWTVTLYTNRTGDAQAPPRARISCIDIAGDRFNAWERVRLPFAALADRLDLLHCPSQTAPPLTPCRMVLTVHDLIPIRIGDGLSGREVARFYRDLARSVERARRIITVSEFTKRDLLSTFRIPESKVDVIRWGVERRPPEAPAEEGWAALCEAYKLRPPFFLAYGGDVPRKNVPGILRALACFVREVTADVQLVLVGVSAHATARFGGVAEGLGISKQVVMLGYVSDDALAHLLTRAEALVYASLYEGFGLPILEGMAMGAPVITSNVTSMPEIAGDAALLVDPRNPGGIAEAMRSCYLNDSVKGDLRARGLHRIEGYAWDVAARETLATYRRALGWQDDSPRGA